MKELDWYTIAIHELVKKWAPIMNDHVMEYNEVIQLHTELKEAGIDVEEFIHAMEDKYGEGE